MNKTLIVVKMLPLLALICFCGKAKAQFVLTDSIEFGPKTLIHVTKHEHCGSKKLALRRGWLEKSVPSDSINEIFIEDKYSIRVPSLSHLLYIDEEKAIFNQFIRGNPALDEPGKYIDGYKIISKYTIDDKGGLVFVDSIRINIEDLPIRITSILQPEPIVITAPLAVEGGGGNYGYNIYDEKLKHLGVIMPDLRYGAGINCRVIWANNEINLLDQDPIYKNEFSWCKTDFSLRAVDCKRVLIDPEFDAFGLFVIKDYFCVSGHKKINGDNKYLILVYSRDGNLLHTIDTDGLLVRDINVADEGIVYFGFVPRRYEVVVLDKTFKPKYRLNTRTHQTSLLPNKVLIYNDNKIMVYEIK